ncbi:Type II secretory pathway, ATPase PulE/Tfp pilus assembly pathway, ATPase PilB [Sterolibacterium denitrificans]|uniref:Type II secretory pathway, ATPase PulE/Tfp pilus assembly pathway, ATPase PilB n=2 Tax=Sterolibacterium denitrificans TaxID=157592 RepID=A0A7Z7HSS2_9PROT|nr:Type II secretory pathway, ATPase PulE/Tfp pilus assembly pathway, ATPase PilB [Sterolibacterium denitrificans]
MSAKSESVQAGGSIGDVSKRLMFFKNLQAVTNKIHATNNIDEIMLELSQDLCSLFNADRLTIYAVSEDKTAIVSKVKTGLNSFKDLKLPITDQSIAGYAALSRQLINISDVYDDAELKSYHENLHFLQEVDKRTGYRTKQMLVAPVATTDGDVVGVVQVINNKADEPFSNQVVEGLKGLCETLAIAFSQRAKLSASKTKYDNLVNDAVISAQELKLAIRSARRKNTDIESVLISEFQVKLAAIGAALAKFFNVPYEPYKADRVKPMDLLKNLKRDYLEQNQWLPLEETSEGTVIMAMDPEQLMNSRVVSNIFPRSKLAYRVSTLSEFRQTLDAFFGAQAAEGDSSSVDDLLTSMADDDEGSESSASDVSAAADNELVKLVNKIIIDAYQQGASDIHIEPSPGKEKTLVRFRRDGSLFKYIEVPASYRNAMVARIKIMCDLDISERRKPQDGKIKFKKFGPVDIELRVATIPSVGGEDVVMRILAGGEPIPLDKLGVLPENLDRLKSAISKPYGLFFVCGPTGSGKTTTLHSVLKYLNTSETKIWTAEDPVEITQKGLRQVQVNRKAGIDFAMVMRAFLRADPDIIMVGEMRDAETTGIGIEASLTGHLVFATLHTNSAPESVVRLIDMGMDPFNFSDALLGILAQRLAKRLCKCKEPYTPDEDEMRLFIKEYCTELQRTEAFLKDADAARDAIYQRWLNSYAENGKFTLYRPRGCVTCNETGYKGRMGLHELMLGSDRVKKLIQEGARVAELLACALEEGMTTLKMDGMEKVLQGHLDLKTVRSVCIK